MNENHNQVHKRKCSEGQPKIREAGRGGSVRRKSSKGVISKEQTSSQAALKFNFSVRTVEARLSVHE